MPTSSQALLFYKNEVGGTSSRHRQSQTQVAPWTPNRDPAPMAQAEIYNLGGCMPLSAAEIKDRLAIEALGRESAEIFKHHALPRGYTSILSFDKETQEFRWEAIGGTAIDNINDVIDTGNVIYSSSLEDQTSKRPVKKESVQRPKTAVNRWKSKSVSHVDRKKSKKLEGLVYQDNDLVVEKMSPIDCTCGTRPSRTYSGPAVARPKSSFTRSITLHSREERETKSAKEVCVDSRDSDLEKSDSPDEEDEEDDVESHDGEHIDAYTRIKPTIYMRKDSPEPRPCGAVLSFRDNECSSHADVKYLIETQLSVRVTSVQYDPLNVRVERDDVRSRWLVDFKTVGDLETAVKSGLIVGNDHIIIYRFDDLAKRELASFKYFMTIQEAKRKLKATKSWKTVKASKNALKVRATKSYKH